MCEEKCSAFQSSLRAVGSSIVFTLSALRYSIPTLDVLICFLEENWSSNYTSDKINNKNNPCELRETVTFKERSECTCIQLI